MALEHEGDVDFDFRQAGSYILKRRVVYFETLCILDLGDIVSIIRQTIGPV